MHRTSIPTLIALTLTAAASAEPAPIWQPVFDQLELTEPASVNLTSSRWRTGGPQQLSRFTRYWDDWRGLDDHAVASARRLIAAQGTVEALLREASAHLDVQLDASPPAADDPPSLVDAITALHDALSDPLDESRRNALQSNCNALPPPVAQMAAIILDAARRAIAQRNAALLKLGPTEKWQAFYDAARRTAIGYPSDAQCRQIVDNTDLAALLAAGQTLAWSIDRALQVADIPSDATFVFQWVTPAGDIVLRGAGNDEHDARPYLLLIDTAGDDTYAGVAANASPTQPVSVAIDLAGNDRYESDGSDAFAAALLGFAVLIDREGNDVYRVDQFGCAAASMGAALLVDQAGDDKYIIDRWGQAAAALGVAVLCDRAGNDTYNCFHQAQGMAKVRSCAALIDIAGDDKYHADDEDIRYPSAQSKEHNQSLAQGFGYGRGGHYPGGDGISFAGGVGILTDAAGDDSYFAGLFAQGCSYWYAMGMFVDLAGNDTYRGVWYNQGSAVHHAIAALIDEAGNDQYHALMYQAIGAGYDYSVGLLADKAGDDIYRCGSHGLAWGNWAGIGLLFDHAGNDKYDVGGNSLGQIGTAPAGHTCLSVLIDQGGDNTFPEGSPAKQSTRWGDSADARHGIGVSR